MMYSRMYNYLLDMKHLCYMLEAASTDPGEARYFGGAGDAYAFAIEALVEIGSETEYAA